MRYKLYREHKYISAAVNDVVRLLAKADFLLPETIIEIKEAFANLWPVLAWHSRYEDEVYHPLLASHGVYDFAQIETDHLENKQKIIMLEKQLAAVAALTNPVERVEQGYQLYLAFRKFSTQNLEHLDVEEECLLPALQRLCSDDELRVAEFGIYKVMPIDEMIQTIKTIFPHMNVHDRRAILTDFKACDPQRFAALWEGIQADLAPAERASLAQKLL